MRWNCSIGERTHGLELADDVSRVRFDLVAQGDEAAKIAIDGHEDDRVSLPLELSRPLQALQATLLAPFEVQRDRLFE